MEDLDEKKKKYRTNIRDSIILIIICVVVYLIIQTFFVQIIQTDQLSMYPTIGQDEIWLVDKWSWITKHEFNRGDIVIIQEPSKLFYDDSTYEAGNVVAKYENIFTGIMSKRIIALPGEHIKIENGKVYINDKELEEPYLYKQESTFETSVRKCYFLDLVVPENCVFVMGDNREQSDDSRNYGCIPIDKIQGFLKQKIYPFQEKYSKEYIKELVRQNLEVNNYEIERISFSNTMGNSISKDKVMSSGKAYQSISYKGLDVPQIYIYEDAQNKKTYDITKQTISEVIGNNYNFSEENCTIQKEYSNLLRRILDDGYTYRYIGEELINGEDCIHFCLTGDEDINLEHKKYQYWVRKSDGIIIKCQDYIGVQIFNTKLNQVTEDDFGYDGDLSNYKEMIYIK